MDSLHKPASRTPTHPRLISKVAPSSVYSQPPIIKTRPEAPKISSEKFLKIFFVLFFFIALSVFGYVFFKNTVSPVEGHLTFENTKYSSFFSGVQHLFGAFATEKHTPLRGEADGRINILLLGRAGEKYPGRNLTDTVMMLSIDTQSKQVALLSLPRDLYAPIFGTDLYTKINSLYQYGLDSDKSTSFIRTAVEEITGQPIHYFAIVDFDGFEKIIDALGGIRVEVPRDFYDTRYPGKHYDYETFELKKGWQLLDGKTALKYVRERHNDPEGDFGRAKRQQQVLQAVKEKVFSTGTILNVFTLRTLLTLLGESIQTDMPLEDIRGFLDLARTIDTKNVPTVVIDAWKKESLLRVSHIQIGSVAAFILVPRVGNWSEIQDVAKNIFKLDTLHERENLLSKEQATVVILYATGDEILAQKLSVALMDALPALSVSKAPKSTLENRPERSMIIDKSNLTKPFTLDELIKRFGFDTGSPSSAFDKGGTATDFFILLGDNARTLFDFEASGNDPAILEHMEFQESLPPQQRKSTR